jgi:hypothetical protein
MFQRLIVPPHYRRIVNDKQAKNKLPLWIKCLRHSYLVLTGISKTASYVILTISLQRTAPLSMFQRMIVPSCAPVARVEGRETANVRMSSWWPGKLLVG